MSEALLDTNRSLEEPDRGWGSIWRPTSKRLLAKAEKKILQALDIPYSGEYVKVNDRDEIWTVKINPTNSKKTPLVLMHGFGAGLAFWVLNFKALSHNRPVYAIDTLGFGRSSRRTLPFDAEKAEEAFVECIDGWRKSMKIDKMILLGHSFGGYLAFAYGLRHPDKLKHLILADPWGFPNEPEERDKLQRQLPFWVRGVAMLAMAFNPLSGIRALGPFGPFVVRKIRGDIQYKFRDLFDDDRIMNYIYHCNAQQPASGETAFKSMSSFGAWAQQPMLDRIHLLDPIVPLDMIYGTKTWMDLTIGEKVFNIRKDSWVKTHFIKGAGHHVYADKAEEFNSVINKICHNIN
ncbi:(Lyso)-N-acylphosphatidylethanolamine lipase-like [Apostichopus japonicus]|uniref:(Lyso)-N-acylphosphatidylethanolamine lipase-like n=1 Tax=Stichopus japonicus TaxID=307972 RepID=UPI003AB89E2B